MSDLRNPNQVAGKPHDHTPTHAAGQAHDHEHAHDDGRAHDHAHARDSGHAHDAEEAHVHTHREGTDSTVVREQRQARRLFVVLAAIAVFFVVELIGAKAARSDVLEADAYHLLMDVFALAVSLGAMRIANARPSARFTYGLRRVEPLAALVNGVLVLGVAIELVHHALEHLENPTTPKSGLMLMIASAALVVNGFSAWILHGAMHAHGAHGHDHGHGHGHDHGHALANPNATPDDDDDGHHAPAHAHHLNLRGAWLHLLGDALGSVAALGAGLAIRFGASPIVDPLASFLVVAILVVGAVRLVRDASLVLLDAAPPRLPVEGVRKAVLRHPGVKGVHALHVWSLGTGHDAVTVHVTADGADPNLGTRVGDALRTRFRAEYVTVQVDVVDAEGRPICAPGRDT